MNKEDILLLTDKGLAVFKHYIPFPFKLGRNFLNPLYKDSKASCNVYFDRRSGMYKMKDFGNDDYSGDCFALVGKLNGLNCKELKTSWKYWLSLAGICTWGYLKDLI